MNYTSDPVSRVQLRNYARSIKEAIGLTGKLYFPVLQFLECFSELNQDPSFYYEVIDDYRLPGNIHAEYDYDNNCIRIKESVYRGAYNGNGRDRMTIMHELSHVLLLKMSGLRLYRSFDNESNQYKAYCDPEWQAKCLAGEFMVDADMVRGMTVHEVAEKCGVSQQAATVQLKSIK